MTEATHSKGDPKRLFARISIGSLALAGLMAAVAATIGGESWKAFSTAGLIFILNLLLLISFSSPHKQLRVAQWGLYPIVIVISAVYVWYEVPYTDNSYVDSSGEWVYVRSEAEVIQDWLLGLWWPAVALAFSSLFSKLYLTMQRSKGLLFTYGFTIVTVLVASVVAWISVGVDDYDGLMVFVSVLAILALTGAAIVSVSAFLERNRSGEKRLETPSAGDGSELEHLIDSRIEAYLTDPANREKIRKAISE